MANTIDLKGAIVNITPTKTVKFQNMPGTGGGSRGPGGPSAINAGSFLNKGEYKNLGKFIVLTGQSLKKMNVNLRDSRKELKEIKSILGSSLELDKLVDKERRREAAAAKRRRREQELESRKANLVKPLAKGAAKGLDKGKSLIGRLLNFFLPVAGIASVLAAFPSYQIVKKAIDSGFLQEVMKGLFSALGTITNAIKSIPNSVLLKSRKFIGRFIKFLGDFVSG